MSTVRVRTLVLASSDTCPYEKAFSESPGVTAGHFLLCGDLDRGYSSVTKKFGPWQKHGGGESTICDESLEAPSIASARDLAVLASSYLIGRQEPLVVVLPTLQLPTYVPSVRPGPVQQRASRQPA